MYGALKIELGNMLRVPPPDTYLNSVKKFIDVAESIKIRGYPTQRECKSLLTVKEAKHLRSYLFEKNHR